MLANISFGKTMLNLSSRTLLTNLSKISEINFVEIKLPNYEYNRKQSSLGTLCRVSQEERSVLWEVIVSVILNKSCIYTCVLFRTVSEIELFHCTVRCTDMQHAISSHELQDALMLTVKFTKMYHTVPTLSLEQYIPVLKTVRNISFLWTILVLYSVIAPSQKPCT
jgi:hypothetical protein